MTRHAAITLIHSLGERKQKPFGFIERRYIFGRTPGQGPNDQPFILRNARRTGGSEVLDGKAFNALQFAAAKHLRQAFKCFCRSTQLNNHRANSHSLHREFYIARHITEVRNDPFERFIVHLRFGRPNSHFEVPIFPRRG